VIADDSLLLREGLARLLDELGHTVVAAVDDAPSLVTAVEEHRPDLALVDVRMPPTFTDDGLRAAVDLRARHPDVAVLVLSQYVETSYADELFASGQGSVGYLLKDRVQDLDVLERAIETVAGGGSVLDPEVVARLLSRRRDDDPVAALTPRERDVLGLMAEGRSNRAIATELVVSEGAVQKHIGNIFTKLDLLPSDEDHRRVLAVRAWLNRR
jgi:DNA-binding NarL/FixJ family response regulator